MNSKNNFQNELNEPPIINLNIIPNSQKINSILITNTISSNSNNKDENKQIIENKDDAKIIAKIKEKDFCNENETSKALINEQNSKLLESLNNNNINFSLKILNPGSNKNETASNELNSKLLNNEINFGQKKLDDNSKKNKSQFGRNSINVPPKEINKFFHQMNCSVFKIKLFKSYIKPKRNTILNENNFMDIKNEIKTENKSEINTTINDFNDKKYKYKLLIKRIANQLKRRSKPVTKGYFYVNIIRTDKYMRKIKKIAKKMKISVFPPTHGFFYNFIQKEKQYKILVKKIASQLKKRIKFPTCKIIKIYESYRKLIKRIAESLKLSIINKKEKEEKSTKIILGNNSNDNSLIIESNSCVVEELNNNIQVISKENNNLENDMDIEMDNNEIQNDIIVSKEENFQNEFKGIKYSNLEMPSLSQNNVYEEIDLSISKKEIIEEGMPKSAEGKKNSDLNFIKFENNDRIETDGIEQLEKVEHNKKELLLPKMKNDIFLNNDLNQEINIQQNMKRNLDKNIQIEDLKKEQNNIIEEKEKLKEEKNIEESSDKSKKIGDDIHIEKIKTNEKVNSSNEIYQSIINTQNIKSFPCLSKKNKNIQLALPVFRKEYFNEINEKKIQNRSQNISEINLNLNNINNYNYLNNNSNNNDEEENIKENNEKISLSDIEATNSKFIKKFKKFLMQENIEIIDNFPVSLNNSNEALFQQSNFWYLLIIYLLQQNKNISLYSIIHLLEQYKIWSKDKNEALFLSIKEKVNEYIGQNYSKEMIEQFLFMNKYKDLNQLFEKFEISKKAYDYKEIKIDNINIINDRNNFECKCELCINDKACIQKILDLNKNKINIVNDTSIYFEKASPEEYHTICQNNLIQKTNRNNIFHNNEAIFFKNISEKRNNNYYFSKSKTIFIERPNIEFNYIPTKNQYKIINPNNLNDDNQKNLEIINKNITETAIENDNNNDNENHIGENEDIVEYEEKRKTFKNISKIKEKNENHENSYNSSKKEKVKNEIDLKKKEKFKFEEKIIIKEDESIEEKEKEKEEILDEDNKSNKNEKKNKKAKSRIKNKKKKDFSKINNENDDKDLEENKNENEEKFEEAKKGDEKSNKKKKKSGNSTIKKKHKSKFVDNNKEEEKNELEEMLKEEVFITENEKEIEDEREINSSKKKKSKSPNRKKNKKH